jgi:tryptophan-rich sensory protein
MMPTLVVAILIAITLLGIGGATTDVGPWYRDLRKPWWNPPNWLFAPAWTLVLCLAAFAGALAWENAPDAFAHRRLVILGGVNIVFHLAWCPLFFTFKRPDWALYEVPCLWLSILALVIGLAPFSPASSWLLMPYLGWVAFAAWLNFTIVRMNPGTRREKAEDPSALRS